MDRPRQCAVFIWLCMAMTAYGGAAAAPATTNEPWKHCANEDQACSFPGTRAVRYGANDTYFQLTLAGPVACSNAVFGDPLPGVAKSCSFQNDPPAPAIWTYCAPETAEFCKFPGVRLVRYGANGSYIYQTVSDAIRCTNFLFPSDPAPGVDKTCSYASDDLATATSEWIECATEDQQCSVAGTQQVRYGANATFVYKTVTGPVECSNAVFGDPIPNADKTCSTLANTAPAPGDNWTVVDLGTLGGGETTVADINDSGSIVGASLLANGKQHAFLYQNGQMSDLGTLAGDDTSRAAAINNAGAILGLSMATSQPSPNIRVFVSGSSGLNQLALPSVGVYVPIDINDSGDMVINYQGGNCFGCMLVARADGSILDLRSSVPAAVGLTNGGTIVGYSGNSYANTTFYNINDGTRTQIIRVTGASGGTINTAANAWNNHGEVAGTYGFVPPPQASAGPYLYLYRDGIARDIRATIPGQIGFVNGMNDNRDLIGYLGARDSKLFFLYEDSRKALITLNDLPAVKNGNWKLDELKRINNTRQIIGYGINANGQRRAILITPL